MLPVYTSLRRTTATLVGFHRWGPSSGFSHSRGGLGRPGGLMPRLRGTGAAVSEGTGCG
jgi:hypothetical protein